MEYAQKQTFVEGLHNDLKGAELVVVARPNGMTVSEVDKMRADMRSEGARYRVVKNTLARRAVVGTPFEGLAEHFKGVTALAFSDDPVAPARIACRYAEKSERMDVVAGSMAGKALSREEVQELATIPPMDELRAKLLGVLSMPAVHVTAVIQARAESEAQS